MVANIYMFLKRYFVINILSSLQSLLVFFRKFPVQKGIYLLIVGFYEGMAKQSGVEIFFFVQKF